MLTHTCTPILTRKSKHVQLRLKDLGKVYPYNKMLPELLSDENAQGGLYT